MEAFKPTQSRQKPLYIGSMKSNIGHLEGASGLAALIKATMMLENALILPNANFQKSHPSIPLDTWNMKVLFQRFKYLEN